MTSELNIVFAGTPDFAADHLQALIDKGYNVTAAYCQPDRKAGRGKKLQAPPVKVVAEQNQIPVYQPLNFKAEEDVEALKALQPDLLIVVAYGLLLPQAVLDIPRYGCVNVHASLLPRWRGAAPIERAIEAGDNETGVTIMQMDIGLDTGDMLNIKKTPITATTTGDELRQSLMELGCEGLIETLEDIRHQRLQPEVQDDSLACYASKLSKAEALIDWSNSVQNIDQKIRAFTSSNVCVTQFKGERVKIWAAEKLDQSISDKQPGEILAISKHAIDIACSDGVIRVSEMQLPNAKRMAVNAILNGKKDLFNQGDCFE